MNSWIPPPTNVCLGGMRGLWLTCVLLALFALPVRAQSTMPVLATPAPTTLSMSEVMERSAAARSRLQAITKKLSPPGREVQIETELSSLRLRVDELAEETTRRLNRNPPLSMLPDIEMPWVQIRPELNQSEERLAKLGKEQDVLTLEILQLANDAESVRAALSAMHAPPEIIERDDLLRAAIAKLQEELLARHRKLLLWRDQISESLARVDETIADIESFSHARVRQVFQPETVPLWRQPLLWDGAAVATQMRQSVAEFTQPLLPYLRGSGWKLGLQILVFVLAALLLRQGHATAAAWPQRDLLLEQFVAISEYPWAAALLASLLTAPLSTRGAPLVLWMLLGWLALPATLRVLFCVLDQSHRFLAYVLAIYAGIALLRGVFSASPPLLQAFVTAETLLACGLLSWVVQRRADRLSPRVASLLRTYGPVGIALLAADSVAALLGYLDLAQLVAFAALGSVGIGVMLLIGTRIVLGLSSYLLRVRPCSDLRLVRRNRDRILGVVTRTLLVATVLLWMILVLYNLRLLDGFRGVLQSILDVRLHRGAISLSLEDILEFGITIWISWALSSFLCFVLEEDIYPRITLPRGAPYAISTLLRYGILVFGFFVALGVIGVDLTKATILAGALGVGVGFGLQNVVNNFVSGLILLFERPVQVGDTVSVRDIIGTVQHIGIRSCIVRTADGAEVILPNAVLISDPVTNWTLSTQLRRLTLSVGVGYGSDPALVTELLRGVAATGVGVLTAPEPQALFIGFGESALTFQLRVWTDRFDSWVVVQSDLYLALHKALADAGISIPFPQHEVHIDGATPLPVRVVGDDASTKA